MNKRIICRRSNDVESQMRIGNMINSGMKVLNLDFNISLEKLSIRDFRWQTVP